MEQAVPTAKPPPVIGLSGGIAAGKTSVSHQLREKGAYVIDADSVGHRVIAPDGEAYADVVAAFGPEVLAEDGAIDRRKLGGVVFADPERLKELNAITHPRMAARMAGEIAQVRDRPAAELPPLILLDAAILFEAGWDDMCDETWVVVASAEVALERLMTRNGLGREQAEARLRAQMSNEERIARAQRVIRNEGSLDALYARVEQIWDEAAAGGRTARREEGSRMPARA